MNKKILILLLILYLFPVHTIKADELKLNEKKITVNCVCSYENGSLSCSEKVCSETKLLEDLQKDCGKNGTLSNTTFTCKKSWHLFTRVTGTSVADACSYLGPSSQHSNIKLSASTTCEAKHEAIAEFFCEEEGVVKTLRFLGYILYFLKILVPFILIFVGVMDYYKAMVHEKSEELSAQTKVLIKRVITGLLIFFIPSILNMGLILINGWSDVEPEYQKCASCVLEPIKCDTN